MMLTDQEVLDGVVECLAGATPEAGPSQRMVIAYYDAIKTAWNDESITLIDSDDHDDWFSYANEHVWEDEAMSDAMYTVREDIWNRLEIAEPNDDQEDMWDEAWEQYMDVRIGIYE